MLLLKVAAITAAVPAVFAAGLASLDWMVVDVREGGPNGHRIVVLRDREKVTEFSGEVDEQQIMHAMAGGGS